MRPPSPWRRHGPRLAVSLLIGVALVWMLTSGGLPLYPPVDAFAEVEPWAVPLYSLSLVGVHVLRAVRWRHLLRPLAPVTWRAVLSTSWLGFAAVLFLPLRAGEVVRPYLVTQRSAVRGWQAAGTVGAERILDGLALSGILLVALEGIRRGWSGGAPVLDPLPTHVGDLPIPVTAVYGGAYAALALFAACMVVMLVFYWQRELAQRLTRAAIGWLSPRLADRLTGMVARVAEGLRFLPSSRRLVPFLLETAGYWALNALGLWLLARGCGLTDLGLWHACVVMGCLGIGILVPSAPGYFGTFQLSVYLALAMFVAADRIATAGSAFVFIAYTSQVVQHALGGLAGAALYRSAPAVDLPASGAEPG